MAVDKQTTLEPQEKWNKVSGEFTEERTLEQIVERYSVVSEEVIRACGYITAEEMDDWYAWQYHIAN